ncbi:MAG: hypothetical protein A2381_10425 [Bdellovibrionales bacterium RIFOXYB1_FULL_37_110]|nr:MAG: hypothetical protein A2417_05695 [Bdellovibrionales bacterium RIFOXYC1_FULL_37_79]OFZ61178.1 MAG: hypothetical protein A2381_10425 [Bdellovibrionales bacterium RIFOXYB1_FULL_37_110]OFZ65506.1 MAG: hypothetical protein A2577_01845 [Bdellovibrionales bacterium RIFOXYD1_FULL_36_51]
MHVLPFGEKYPYFSFSLKLQTNHFFKSVCFNINSMTRPKGSSQTNFIKKKFNFLRFFFSPTEPFFVL